MKNKGFTLVEIIVVLILLTLIGFMVGSGLNNVFKTQKQKDFDTLVAKITSAADVYLADNTNLISELETRKAFLIIKVKDIIDAGRGHNGAGYARITYLSS